ncbi:MAG: hypothetical protein IT423_24825, partial [Pirellulaceae bacterium]|nr:hypothetical protein [Pirellulaceae bacterium]
MSTSDATSQSFVQDRSVLLRRGLDLVEKIILLTFYAYFLIPIMKAALVYGDKGAVLLAISETLVVALVFFRKPAQILSQRPQDWLLAFGATLAPTLVRPATGEPHALAGAAALLMVAGIVFQIGSKL